MTYLPLYQPVMYLKENIHLKEGKPQAVLGENGRVSALEVGGEAIPCDGIFFAKNSTAPESLLFGLETDGKNIVVDRAMKTNLPGVFAGRRLHRCAVSDCEGGSVRDWLRH